MDLTEVTYFLWFIGFFVGRYFFLTFLLYHLFYVWKRSAFLRFRIQASFPPRSAILREMRASLGSAVIFSVVGILFLHAPLTRYTRLYEDIGAYGVWYFWVSVGLCILLHDAYFYWLHRLMHLSFFYKRVHLLHHRSMNPTPWAAYAFHPFEAIFEAGIIPLLLMLIPLHRTAFYLFSAIMLWANLYGHIGFEFMSPRIAQHPIFRWLNTGLNHNYHHRHFQGNYGLYFTFWDWLMGTLRVPDSNLGSEFDDPRGEELLGKNKLSG